MKEGKIEKRNREGNYCWFYTEMTEEKTPSSSRASF
jgi:hypothetical protein